MAYITKALNKDPVIKNTPEQQIEKNSEWEKTSSLASTFADSLHHDPGLMESDADELSQRFEKNVMNFQSLGYTSAPDAYAFTIKYCCSS